MIDFDGDLDKNYFSPANESGPVTRPQQGTGLNYMPVGTLVALPLTQSRAPSQPNDLTRQHHMSLYLSSLRGMQLNGALAAPQTPATLQ
jgi:hypothetical protein